jgi:hypothetical protein
MSSIQGSSRLYTDGLILYYDPVNIRSYSGSGNSLTDLSISSNNASLLNGTSFTKNYFSFDGTNDYILLNPNEDLKLLQVPMTIMGWFNDNGNKLRPTIFSQYFNAAAGNLVKLVRVDAGVLSYYSSKNGSPNFQAFQMVGLTASFNTWNFFSISVSGTTASPQITLTLNTYSETFTASGFTSANTSVELRIGSAQSTFLAADEYFSGKISSIFIYNRVLSEEEINYTYNITKIKFQL